MHAAVPGVLDNVFFDANSFSLAGEVVTIDDSQVNFNDLDASAVSAAFTLSGNSKEMNIYGSVNFPAIVSSSVATYNFLATGSETLKFDNGPGTSRDFNFLSAGNWTLNSNLLLDELQLESGTLNTNNYDVLVDFQLRMDGTNAKTLTLGTSTLTVGSWHGSGLNNITVNGSTSTINITGSFLLESDGTNSVTLNNLTFSGTTGNSIYYDVTLNKCTIEAGNTLKTSGIVTITANEFVLTGTSTDPIVFEPQTTNSKLTLSQPTGTVNGDYLHLKDITATGGATFNAYNSVDNGGVIGWIFHRSSQTIDFAALPDKIFGDPDFEVSATASSGLSVSFSIVSGPATISGTTVSITGTGTVEIKAEQAGNIEYDPAPSVTNSFEVAKADQTITFEAIADINIGEVSSIELIASATSGLAVEFTVVGPATINGSTLTPTSPGMVTVTAKQSGNATYNAATEAGQVFEIIDNITGLEDLRANNINIYPQPAQNILFIGQPNKEFDSIIIYDLNGMAVLQKGSSSDLIEVNTTALPNGIYFLKLFNREDTFTTRIVVNR
ncbi:MAG: T9SS type A sorting domain-containing protein [Cyclobacteriaceae bacterium]|nr:T9SS type A sorting domain-containing protein [Cyclobacteriaceae bacterium]